MAALFGALLGTMGQLGHDLIGTGANCADGSLVGAWVVGGLAIAYAASDLDLIGLPRPTLMPAVPVTWWRWWRPYTAALAYGAALGLGLTTRIHFGAFYILGALAVLAGDVTQGALLMGTYGAARALVLFPANWGLARHRDAGTEWLASPSFDLGRARRAEAVALMAFGTQGIVTAALMVF